MGTVSEDAGRLEKLVKVLGLSTDKLGPDEMLELKGLLHEYSDIFALTDQELLYRYWGEYTYQAAALSHCHNT